MTAASSAFLVACERHDAAAMAAALDDGIPAVEPLDGRMPVVWLLGMYTRSDRLPACLRVLLDRGASAGSEALTAVLLDDAAAVRAALAADPGALITPIDVPSSFTPLEGASLLHVAAEFGLARAARALVDLGADVHARAALDGDGLGGQTPLFHTVNAHANRAAPILRLLLDRGADPEARVAGLTWGRGFEWETTLFDLTPIAYAQLGLLPQMHRDARDIDDTLRTLLRAAGRPVPPMPNVPNRYLAGKPSAS